MIVTVTRTHHRGQLLPDRDRIAVPGPVRMQVVRHEALRRDVSQLVVWRSTRGGASVGPPPIPPLNDPQLLALVSEYGAMMVAGFEEIDGQRYYQGWYIRYEDI